MSRILALSFVAVLILGIGGAYSSHAEGGPSRPAKHFCGTHARRGEDDIIRHQVNARRLGKQPGGAAVVTDIGDLAVVVDDGTVVIPPNSFGFGNGEALQMLPQGSSGFSLARKSASVKTGGTKITNFVSGGFSDPTDDGYAEVAFASGFSFPFYGQTYDRMFVGTNGYITFGSGDANSPAVVSAATLRDTQPRVAAFWMDLDTTGLGSDGGIFVIAKKKKTTIVWRGVPAYGSTQPNTFQIQLTRDGKVTFTYGSTVDDPQVVGVAPGSAAMELTAIDLHSPPAGTIGAPFEAYSRSKSIDTVAVARAFYRTHGDDYDFLYLWSGFEFDIGFGFAYYAFIRNDASGIGLNTFDASATYGSAGRLQGLLNLNSITLSVYPDDPNDLIPGLGLNDVNSLLGQEQGHRWLAYVRFNNGGSPSTALLGRDNQHWSPYFHVESTLSGLGDVRYSSSAEGNAIDDLGGGSFITAEDRIGYYTDLDQYLMGLRAPAEVAPTFLVANGSGYSGTSPRNGVSITGTRVTVTVEDIIAVEGPRSPSVETSQKDFRAAWILILEQGTEADPAVVDKLNLYRTTWETYFNDAVEGRGSLSTALVR